MTELELAREYFPGVEPRWAHQILWSCTAHPFYGVDYTRQQLADLRERIGAPHTRGWLRKLARETRRIDADMERETRAMLDRLPGETMNPNGGRSECE